MDGRDIVETIVRGRLVAIIRVRDHAPVVDIAQTLIAAGVHCLEVTIERPTGLEALRRVVEACADAAVVGAGTVLRPDDARRVADAGGSFIVTPNVDPRVLAAARERQLVTLPGAFTPSEVALADECGADFVKLFPAATGGVGHLAALRGPFPNVRVVPTGGVSEANTADWFAAGAVAVAMGSNIVTADASLEGLFERAQRAVRACES